MPVYRISSGDMNCELETAHDADPKTLTVMALSGFNGKLGLLTQIIGGKYPADDPIYCSTKKALEAMGASFKGSKS